MRPTDIEITFKGKSLPPKSYRVPADVGKKMQAMLRRELEGLHGDTEGRIPAEAAFPEAFDPITGPAMALRGLRRREEMTQQQLAAALGIRQHHLSEMENAKRPIGKAMARKLAATLNIDWRIFL